MREPKMELLSVRTKRYGWVYKGGTLHCDGMALERLRQDLRQEFGYLASPAFVYSSATLTNNVRRYRDALAPLEARGVLSYALKANSNPALVKVLREAGVQMATTVSGNEILLALSAGFPGRQIIFNGNGKRRWEVELAVRRGVLLNVDSGFDARQVVEVAGEVGIRPRVLVRLNPAINPQTHPYLATALADSKFGVDSDQLEQVLRELGSGGRVAVVGVHIHAGSALTHLPVYVEMMQAAVRTLHQIRESGWDEASIINLGGGLDVPHTPPSPKIFNSTQPPSSPLATTSPTGTMETSTPTPGELVQVVLPHLPEGVTLLLEPGRSLVATAGVLMTQVLGVKVNAGRKFVVVDAAITEVIRPAFYGVQHPLLYISPPSHQDVAEVDVVGPLSENGDFLARRCLLQRPPAVGAALVVWEAGAYCASMASNYNLRPRAIEVLVQDAGSFKVIRRPQEFADLVRDYL
ncbi:uncharacterized protein [Panulirus ornatus]|uniref:uncharacterized protein isoform X2 n=1 Tax=Panulirus ornatus TaxID=150431 RepID=UPI003A871B42